MSTFMTFSQKFLFWNGAKTRFEPMWFGETATIPSRDEVFTPDDPVKRHFYSYKGEKGYVPGTLVMEDRIELDQNLGRNKAIFEAAQWMRAVAEKYADTLFKRGLRLVSSPQELDQPGFREAAYAEWDACELQAAVELLATERWRRIKHERLGEDVPPMSTDYERQLVDAQTTVLAAQARQGSKISTKEIEDALRHHKGIAPEQIEARIAQETATDDPKALIKRAQEKGVYVKKELLERIFLHEDPGAVAEVAALLRQAEEKQTASVA